MKKLISFILVLSLFSSPVLSATISNGGATILDDNTKVGKVEFCPATFQNKEYNQPTWIQHVMSPISDISSGVSGLIQVPVMLVRSAERPLEQSVSKSRKEGNPCFNIRYRVGQSFKTDLQYKDINMGDSVTVGEVNVSINISGDTT